VLFLSSCVGSLALRAVEFAIVGKMKKDAEEQGASLAETSIYRSQQLDLVTVPIKLRAIVKGIQTGLRDRWQYHDNSWWESFGGGHAKASVQTWLTLVYTMMILSLIVGPVRILVAYFTNSSVVDKIFPVLFGISQAMINLFVLNDPIRYVMQGQGDRPRFSLRYVNVGVLLVITIIAVHLKMQDSTSLI